MTNIFPEVNELWNKLNDVRVENMKHSQYVTARENLKHIFTVPESIQKTEQWINEGKLLHTHQVFKLRYTDNKLLSFFCMYYGCFTIYIVVPARS